MTALAQSVGALGANVSSSLGRLRASREAYAAANKGLWVFSFAIIILLFLMPLYAPTGKVLIAQQAMYIGLLALSLNLLVSTTGLVSFGHAMFFGLGGYMVAVPFAKLDWNPLFAFALSPVVGAVAAFLIGLVVLRGRELYFGLLTLGVGQLIWATAHGWQGLTGGTNGTTGVFAAEWLNPLKDQTNQKYLFWFVFGCTAVCTLMLWVITRSPFGDALRGIRENRRRAEFTGMWVKRYEMTAFVIAGTFGAIAGGLAVISETQIASGQIDWQRSATALIVCLIGGTRYFLGPFAGAIFYWYVQDWIVQKSPETWDIIVGVIVLGLALFLTGGLVGSIHWLFAWIAAPFRGGAAPAPVHATAEVAEAVHLPRVELTEAELAPAAGNGDFSDRPIVIEARGITKAFGGLVAVNNASIQVRQGTLHAIIGPNGAGKTTFFNLLTGLYIPDQGEVLIEGQDVTQTAPWRRVKRGLGRSFQQTSLFWALSAVDNAVLAESAVNDVTLRPWGKQPRSIRERAHGLLDQMGLGSFAGFNAHELSHGDQRSLEIATALAVNSRILLLDEPTAGISPAETKTAVALIKKIARERDLTVLFVEHDMEVVFGIADRITVLARGAVLAEGTPAEIRANPEVQKAYLGEVEEEEVSA